MILYKYFPDNVNSYKALSVRGLWCHHPKMMNDPADCLGYIDHEISFENINLFRNSFKNNPNPRLSRIFNFSDTQIVEFINLQRKERINKNAFCSLSEDFKDILMWSHYASSHTGFVVEFEFSEKEIDHHFQKINYTDILPELDVTIISDFMLGKNLDLNPFFQDISIKSSVWSSEKEWRIWRSKPCYYHFQGNNIKNVYFGANCSMETTAIIVKLVGELNNDALYYFMEFNNNPIELVVKDKPAANRVRLP